MGLFLGRMHGIPRDLTLWAGVSFQGLLLLHVFFIPFPHTTTIKEIAFYGACALFLFLLLARDLPFSMDSPFALPFLCFFGWAALGTPFSLDLGGTLHDLLSHLLRYLALFVLLLHGFHTEDRLRLLTWTLLVSGAAFSLGGLLLYYGPMGNPLDMRFTAGCAQISPNLVAVFTLPSLFLGLQLFRIEKRPGPRAGIVFCLPILLAATLMTQSRGTLIALFAGLLILYSRTLRSALLTGAALLGLMGLFLLLSPLKQRFVETPVVYEGYGRNIRLTIALVSLEVIRDHPVLGVGFGNRIYGRHLDWDAYNQRIPEAYRLTPEVRDAYRSVINDPHNLFFNLAVRVGLVGLLLFLWILFVFYRVAVTMLQEAPTSPPALPAFTRAAMAGVSTFLVIGVFEPVFSHGPEALLFTLFAYLSILWGLHRQGPPSPEGAPP